MSKEYDYEVNRLLHTVTFALNEESEAEEKFYRAKKEYHDSHIKIREKLELAKQEILELIRIKGNEDDKKEQKETDKKDS